MKWSLLTLFAFSVVIFSCKKDDITDPQPIEEKIQISLYQPGANYVEGTTVNQIEIHDQENDMKIHFLGQFDDQSQLKNLKNIIVEDVKKQEDVYIIYDENKLPAFSYVVDRISGQRKKELFEFEVDGDSCFAMRIYEMDWSTSGAKLIRSVLICQTEDGFKSDVILAFETNEVEERRLERLEQVRDFNDITLSNLGTPHENYETLISEYYSENLIGNGLEWMSTMDEIGLDSIANPRTPAHLVIAGAIAASYTLIATGLVVKQVGGNILDGKEPFDDINQAYEDFKETLPSFISNSLAAPFNPYEMMGQMWNGEWSLKRVSHNCIDGSWNELSGNELNSTYEFSINNDGTISESLNVLGSHNGHFNMSGKLNGNDFSPGAEKWKFLPGNPILKANGSYIWRYTKYIISNDSNNHTNCGYKAYRKFQYILEK